MKNRDKRVQKGIFSNHYFWGWLGNTVGNSILYDSSYIKKPAPKIKKRRIYKKFANLRTQKEVYDE